jgi:hypothetical protein
VLLNHVVRGHYALNVYHSVANSFIQVIVKMPGSQVPDGFTKNLVEIKSQAWAPASVLAHMLALRPYVIYF